MRVQPKDAALRRVDDRRREQRSVDAAVGDRERAPLQFGKPILFSAARGEVGDRQFDVAKTHQLGVAQHRHDQPSPPPTATPIS